MEGSRYVNLSGKINLFNQLNATNNNIANSNTDGYNRDIAISHQHNFRDMAFSNDISTVIDRSMGPIKKTDNPLDLAISQPGHYFAIETPRGIRYTRSGNFYVNKEYQIVTKEGFFLLNQEGNNITLETDMPTKIAIDDKGVVFSDGITIDSIGIYSFANPYNMRKDGNVLLRTEQEAQLSKDIPIMRGVLEESNSPSVIEMNNLINISRSFDQATNFNNSVHKLSNEMLQILLKGE